MEKVIAMRDGAISKRQQVAGDQAVESAVGAWHEQLDTVGGWLADLQQPVHRRFRPQLQGDAQPVGRARQAEICRGFFAGERMKRRLLAGMRNVFKGQALFRVFKIGQRWRQHIAAVRADRQRAGFGGGQARRHEQ